MFGQRKVGCLGRGSYDVWAEEGKDVWAEEARMFGQRKVGCLGRGK